MCGRDSLALPPLVSKDGGRKNRWDILVALCCSIFSRFECCSNSLLAVVFYSHPRVCQKNKRGLFQ